MAPASRGAGKGRRGGRGPGAGGRGGGVTARVLDYVSRMGFALAAPAPAACAAVPEPARAKMEFFDEDCARGLGEGGAGGVRIFADVYAPWCHPCRFMREYVFVDRA